MAKKKHQRAVKIVYPIAVEISMKPVGKSRDYEFSYWEGFPVSKRHEAASRQTIAALRAMPKMKVVREDRLGFIGVRITGRFPRAQIGDMLVGEFLPWSNIGTVTLRRMIEDIVLNALGRHAASGGVAPWQR